MALLCAKDDWGQTYGGLSLVHELSHNLCAEDNKTTHMIPIWCVMMGGQYNPLYISDGWYVHWTGSVAIMANEFKG